jgi:hypothetical protein
LCEYILSTCSGLIGTGLLGLEVVLEVVFEVLLAADGFVLFVKLFDIVLLFVELMSLAVVALLVELEVCFWECVTDCCSVCCDDTV